MEERKSILQEMKICRFCLSSDEKELSNIYETQKRDSRHVPLPLQIMACIAIEVFEHDGMPQSICNTCRSQTMQSYIFKTNCKRADDALKVFIHTGQLSKPHMEHYENTSTVMQRQFKIVRKADQNSGVTAVKEPMSKRIKMEDGTEIITLNFERNSDDEIVVPQERLHEKSMPQTAYEEEEEEEDEDNEEEEEETRTNVNAVKNANNANTNCFPCPQCERAFPLQQLLDLHLHTHSRERTFPCDLCNRKFFTKYDLQKHSGVHSGNKPFDCTVCQKPFARESLLRRHEKIHNDVPTYLCTQCDKTFLTAEDLDFHADKHKRRRPFTCNECNKSFVFKQGLERHLIVHSNNKPHKCNYCDATFNTPIKLTRHITSHAGLRPYPCKICNRTFLLSHHLTRHMRSHYAALGKAPEDAVGQHKCDICSMAFRRKDSLINHSAIHSMVNLRCVICNTSFENAQLVKEHITTHLTDLPFPCEKCDYSFETADQLEEHQLKHAEMEYEEQIEKEVMSEAVQGGEPEGASRGRRVVNEAPTRSGGRTRKAEQQSDEGEDDVCETLAEEDDEFVPSNIRGGVTNYTITDMDNGRVAPTRRPHQESKEPFEQFFKNELASDFEESQHGSEESEEEVQLIKPIVRSENTKVYKRKAGVERKIPQFHAEDMKMAPLEEITQTAPTNIEQLVFPSEDIITSTPTSRNMKMGEKVLKVQKFILTKEEMKKMAKEGILEMRGGQVVLRGQGAQSILNATLKPVQKGDIENFISQKPRVQVKQYQRRPPPPPTTSGGPSRVDLEGESNDDLTILN